MNKPQPSVLPPPFQFNAWKHHLSFMQNKLLHLDSQDDLQNHLLALGNSVMDVYTGPLDLMAIQRLVTDYLKQNDIYQADDYFKWLQPAGYKVISLMDHSQWTLRRGELPEFYIHLHPARYSPHSFRIKANLLKTAIMLAWLKLPFGLDHINRVRVEFLHLSPVKNPEPGLKVMVELLRQS